MTQSINGIEKQILVSGKPMILREISIEGIFLSGEEFVQFEKKSPGLPEIKHLLQKFGTLCTDWPQEELMKLTTSQIKKLFEEIKEVNTDFLEILGQLGILQKLQAIKFQADVETITKKENAKHLEPSSKKSG